MSAPELKTVNRVDPNDEETVLGWVELATGTDVSVTLAAVENEVEVTYFADADLVEGAVPDDTAGYTLNSRRSTITFSDIPASHKVYGRVARNATRVLVSTGATVSIN